MTNLTYHKQKWHSLTRYIFSSTEGTITLEIYKEPQGYYDVRAFLRNLSVEPKHRRKGVATELLAMAENKARDLDLDEIFLQWSINDSKDFVRRWYERIGYEDISFTKGWCMMRKEL